MATLLDTDDKSHLRLRDSIWVFLPLIIFSLSEYIRGLLGSNPMETFTLTAYEGLRVEETNRRVFLITSTTFFVVVALASIFYSLYDLFKRISATVWFLFAAFLGLTCLVALYNVLDPHDIFAMSHEIFGVDCSKAPGEKPTFFYFEALKLSSPGLERAFEKLFILVASILVVGVSCIIFGGVSCLAEPKAKKLDENFYKSALAKLETYLLICAILMIAGLVFYMAHMYWPSFIVSRSEDEFKFFNEITRNMTIFTAITYSLMIGSFYLPVRYILLGRIEKLSRENDTPDTDIVKDETQNDNNPVAKGLIGFFSVSQEQREVYSYVLKIISPVLVAWVSQFLHLGGKAITG